jgi:hypothetical protein
VVFSMRAAVDIRLSALVRVGLRLAWGGG